MTAGVKASQVFNNGFKAGAQLWFNIQHINQHRVNEPEKVFFDALSRDYLRTTVFRFSNNNGDITQDVSPGGN